MKLSHIIIGVLAIILIVMVGALTVVLISTPAPSEQKSNASFSVQGFGTAGSYAYASFISSGNGNITLVTYGAEPSKNVYVIDDPQAIDSTRMADFMKELRSLEAYGYNVVLTNETRISEGITVIPAGAMPAYALFSLKEPIANGTVSKRAIILIGSKDLLLGAGIKKLQWYNDLTGEQRRRLLVYDGTLDSYMASSNRTIVHDILYVAYAMDGSRSIQLSGSGGRTYSLPLKNSTHIRLIYDVGPSHGVADSGLLRGTGSEVIPSPQSVFPWEKSTLQFTLEKTNGTAEFSVMKEGKVISHETLQRVTDENVFIEKLQYQEPGDYVLNVSDNGGTISSGILHVKDMQVALLEKSGVTYTFRVLVDGEPLNNAEAYVSVGNSSAKKRFYISQGILTVGAKLDKGANTFNIEYMGQNIPIPVQNDSESVFSFYFTYGIPALVIVLIVYVGARMTKTPTYTLRFGDGVSYVREEIHLDSDKAVEAISLARADMGIGRAPITSHEFAMSLKRHHTQGADLTEGNLEGILKKLTDKGRIQNHREYYQIKGDGDVRSNTLRRMIKEKLIENGVMFRDSGGKFVTKDYEIGLFGEKFARKAIVVVDDESEIKRIMDRLGESERAKMKIRQANGMLSFVPIDRLADAL